MPTKTALLAACLKYQQLGYNVDSIVADVLRLDAVEVRMDKPCGKSHISDRKKCSSDKLKTLTADLKAGDEGAKRRVAEGKRSAERKQKLNRAVERDRGKKPVEIEPNTKAPSFDYLDQFKTVEHYSALREANAYATQLHRETKDERVRLNDRVFGHIMSYIMKAGADPDIGKAVLDKQGNLQAVAVISKGKKALHLEYLATAPWNLPKSSDPRKTKGAGTALIKQIIQQSIKAGHGGAIELESLKDAVPFYQKLGFEVVPNKSQSSDLPYMRLSSESAQKLVRQDAADNATPEDLEERLESGVFSVPSKVAKSLGAK